MVSSFSFKKLFYSQIYILSNMKSVIFKIPMRLFAPINPIDTPNKPE